MESRSLRAAHFSALPRLIMAASSKHAVRGAATERVGAGHDAPARLRLNGPYGKDRGVFASPFSADRFAAVAQW
jgi:hypothetical protein